MLVTPPETRTALRADRLRQWREKKGWSQCELSRRCGVGEAQINKYENGLTDPSLRHLKSLTETLELSADYLIGLSDAPHPVANDALESAERRLLNAFAAGDTPKLLELIAEVLRGQTAPSHPAE